jgi:eukaryotic-like serine/threonine-protein kinase
MFGSTPSVQPPLPPHQPAGPGANVLATLSVVFAFVFAPAGAVLGHLGLRRIARTGEPGRERALVGIVLSYTVITVAVVALVVWSVAGRDGVPASVASPSATTTAPTATTSPPTTTNEPAPRPAPVVDAGALTGILVPLPELRNLIGDQGQQGLGTNDTIALPPADQGGTFSDLSCIASFYDGTPAAYDGTNWRNVLSTASRNNERNTTFQQVGQSVVRFDDAAAAQQALGDYLDKWRACGGKTTQWTVPSGTTTVTFGAPVDARNGITAVTDTVSGTRPGLVYVRVIAAKQNVLLDNTTVGVNLGDIPIRVAQAMLDRIPS